MTPHFNRNTRPAWARWLLVLLSFLFVWGHAVATQKLPDSDALARFLSQSPDKLAVVMVSTPGCPVCEIVRREQLLPLLADTQYQDVAVFEIQMNDGQSALPLSREHLSGGQESPITPRELASNLGIRLAPTILFLNRDRLLAEPLVGYASRDFYWAYLSGRLESARTNNKTAQQ